MNKLVRYKVRVLLKDGREAEGFAHGTNPDTVSEHLVENYLDCGLDVDRILSITPCQKKSPIEEELDRRKEALKRFNALYNLRRRLS